MKELKEFDNTFSEAKFITFVNNVFIQLYLNITTNSLDKVRHFVNQEVYEKFKERLDNLNNNNQIELFDECNVKETYIIDVTSDNDNFIIKVKLVSRYMDYLIDKVTKKFISGNNKYRIEKNNYLIFKKSKSAVKQKEARKCPSCGANIDVNNNGKCSFCGSIYNLENYDWILTSIETV